MTYMMISLVLKTEVNMTTENESRFLIAKDNFFVHQGEIGLITPILEESCDAELQNQYKIFFKKGLGPSENKVDELLRAFLSVETIDACPEDNTSLNDIASILLESGVKNFTINLEHPDNTPMVAYEFTDGNCTESRFNADDAPKCNDVFR